VSEPGGRNGGPGPSPLRFVGIGAELIAPVLVAMYLGHRLDLWLETDPWFLIGGAVLGIVTGFVQFFRSVLPGGPRGPASPGSEDRE
jgi:F0F1-type ATP synthase assembly protein I